MAARGQHRCRVRHASMVPHPRGADPARTGSVSPAGAGTMDAVTGLPAAARPRAAGASSSSAAERWPRGGCGRCRGRRGRPGRRPEVAATSALWACDRRAGRSPRPTSTAPGWRGLHRRPGGQRRGRGRGRARAACSACAPTTPAAGTARTPAVAAPRRRDRRGERRRRPAPGRGAARRDRGGARRRRAAGAPAPRAGAGPASVALVGGGPGDPELITVRGRRLRRRGRRRRRRPAGAARRCSTTLPDDVEVIDCGKSAHRHNLTQDEINAVLVDRARAGKRVVRLKGGDPFVFGRGGEEWLACVAAGVPVHRGARAELGAGRRRPRPASR